MLNNQAKVSFHCTFNVEGLDLTVLTLFVTTQMYSPLSPLITFVIVNVLLFSLKNDSLSRIHNRTLFRP